MKKIAILLCVFMCISVFGACSEKDSNAEMSSIDDLENNLSEENNSQISDSDVGVSLEDVYDASVTPPNSLLDKSLAKPSDKKEKIADSYSLKELTDYFDGIYTNLFKAREFSEKYSFENIDKKFPVRFSRKGSNGYETTYYSVYKVNEGGYFYIFWFEREYNYEFETTLAANYACYFDENRNCSQKEVYALLDNKNSTLKDIHSLTWAYENDIYEQQNYQDKFVVYLLCKEGYLKILLNNPSKDLEKMEAFYIDSISPAKREDAYVCKFSSILEVDLP